MPEDLVVAKRALSWLMFSKRQLRLHELSIAVAIEPEDRVFDDDKKFDNDEMTLQICGSLVKLHSKSSIVEFGHFSVRQYLSLKILPDGTENIYYLDPIKSTEEICKACLTYLSHAPFAEGPCRNRNEYKRRVFDNPFLLYAGLYWPRHARDMTTTFDDEPILDFLMNKSVLLSWAQVWDMYNEEWSETHIIRQHSIHDIPWTDSNIDENMPLALYFAALFGFESATQSLLKRSANINGPCDGWRFSDTSQDCDEVQVRGQVVKVFC